MRRAVGWGLALCLLAAPGAASAQTYCASTSGGNSGYASYVPTGYSHYSGFASFPGGTASGMLPAGYSTNPYAGCAPAAPTTSAVPLDSSTTAASAPTYSATYASNVYNPYSGWGMANAASYPFANTGSNTTTASAGNGTATGSSGSSTAPASSSSWYGGLLPYTNFAGFPGMAPSGSLTSGSSNTAATYFNGSTMSSQPPSSATGGATASAQPATNSYGGYTPTAGSAGPSSGASYTNAAGVPIYYGGANSSSTAGSGATYSGFGGGPASPAGYSSTGISTSSGAGTPSGATSTGINLNYGGAASGYTSTGIAPGPGAGGTTSGYSSTGIAPGFGISGATAGNSGTVAPGIVP